MRDGYFFVPKTDVQNKSSTLIPLGLTDDPKPHQNGLPVSAEPLK